MVKGTPSMGKRIGIKHIRCRRCGKVSYRVDKKYCSYCGYGRSSKWRKYAWQNKTRFGKRRR
jgi:large subunit ribosomal protein L37e